MARGTLIFGNGLGMALDPEYFRLSNAISTVWSGSKHFQPEHKKLVTSAIKGLSPSDSPDSEDQLDQLQVAIISAAFLRSFETDNVAWLTETSRKFPEAFQRLVHS